MRKLLSLIFLTILTFLAVVPKAQALTSVQDFTINEFRAQYFLNNADKQGSMQVKEHIDVTFKYQNHGILRAIPESYKNNSLKIKVADVSSKSGTPTQYSTYAENGNLVLKIGDPNRTVTDRQTYDISYSVSNVASFYDGHDEFYWDINGDQWPQPFMKVQAEIFLPSAVKLQDNKLACYAGRFGEAGQACTITHEDITQAPVPLADETSTEHTYTQKITVVTTEPLNGNETLTAIAGFDKGYFKPETLTDNVQDQMPSLLRFFAPVVLIGGYAIKRWRTYGRDPKMPKTIVPEYEPPYDMRPAEVGAVVDFRADMRDITATIIDLAVRGYIKIIEEKQVKKLRKDTLEYTLELKKEDHAKLLDYETQILHGLFGKNAKAGAVVELKSLKNKFYRTSASAQSKVVARLTHNGYFAKNPASAGGMLWLLVVLIFMALVFLGQFMGLALILGLILAEIIVVVCAIAMPARTAKGADARWKSKGLELYLKTAEADRIKMLQAPNAKYAAHAHLPKKTVELFEKLLPYAMVFGVEKEWANEFSELYTEQPSWYSGSHVGHFNAAYVAGAISGSMNTAFVSAFSSPSSSGGSGFSGGGSSGGGGGGGGGGGW